MRTNLLGVVAIVFGLVASSAEGQQGTPAEESRRLALAVAKVVPPIKIPANARTSKDVQKEQQAWANRILVKPALARIAAKGEVPWAAEAKVFLENAPAVAFTERKVIAPTELDQQARKLVELKCDEPSVLLLAAMIDMRTKSDWRFVWNCVTNAMKAWDADPATPAVLRFYAQGMLGWTAIMSGTPKNIPIAEKNMFEALVKMTSDASFEATEAELLLRHYLMGSGGMNPPSPAKVLELAPQLSLPSWARLAFIGEAEIGLAWAARGSGWASTVTPEGAQGFVEHLGKARKALVQSWKENPNSPLAATLMIRVVMGGEAEAGESLRLWFDRAIAAQCDYPSAYSSILSAYQPRWGGSHELMLAFGRVCLDTKRFDLNLPAQFTIACNSIVSEIGDWRAFYRHPEIAKPLIEMSEGYVKETTGTASFSMRLSYLALNAWLAGDNVRAAGALAKLGGPLHPDCLLKLRSHRVTETEMREEIAVGNSPLAADYSKAVALAERNQLAEAEQLFLKIQPSAKAGIADALRERLQVLQLEKKLATGEWVQLPVDPTLRGWLERGGDWSGTADGVLVNQGTDTEGGIIHRARVGAEFEMKVEFSVQAKEKCCRRCDLYFDWHAGFQEPFNGVSYGQPGKFPAEAKIIAHHLPKPGEVKKGIPYAENNALFLRSSGGKITFTVNGKPAFTDFSPTDFVDSSPAGRVGIGEQVNDLIVFDPEQYVDGLFN